jgi:catechol 2,3-dioxygenase-like lactoylglutathione lyase family enzyme
MNVSIERIDHLVLTVADVEATCGFYARLLGMTPLDFGDGRRALQFGRQKFNLHQAGHEFEPKARRPTPGSGDICLVTAQLLDEVVAHVQACDVAVELGPVERLGAAGLMDSIYFRDPDGNLVEVSQYWTAARQRQAAVRDLEVGQAELEALFTQLTDAQMERPATIGGGEWSAKDLLGHVAAWEQLALQALAVARAWDGVLPDEAGWPGVDTFNAQVYARTSTQALSDVRHLAAEAHAALVDRIRAMDDQAWQTQRGERSAGELLGSITGGRRGPFRHTQDHRQDLAAFVEHAAR